MKAYPTRYPPRLLLVLPLELPSATIYIWKPLLELARSGQIVLNKALESQVTTTLLHSSDLVMFCRNNEPSNDWILHECLAQNIPTTYDLDDNFWEVPLDLYYARHHRAPERIRMVEHYLKHVRMVRVYSQFLQARVQEFNPSVYLANPCIDIRLVPNQALPPKDQRIRITYATGRGGDDALLELFSEDLENLFAAHPGMLEMYWWGEIPRRFRGLPAHRFIDIIQDYDEYIRYLSHAGIDIGLAPLTPSSFNRSKTNTKFRDYGACRIAGIYSNVDVYADVTHEHTGLIVGEEPGAWFTAMNRLVNDNVLRKGIKENAYQYILDHYRQELAEQEWMDLIHNLLRDNQHIFPVEDSFPVEKSQRKLRILSSEEQPEAGFINLAPAPGAGVNLVANPRLPLPFAPGALDAIVIDRVDCLSADFDHLLHEAYRVSAHGGQVGLSAGYTPLASSAEQTYHEFTPQQWTSTAAPVYHNMPSYADLPEGYAPPDPLPGIDIRCEQIYLYYSPTHLNSKEDQRRSRWAKPGVCDEVVYLCTVYKQPEVPASASPLQRLIPTRLVKRGLSDQNEALKQEVDGLHELTRTWRSTLKDLQDLLAQKEGQLAAAGSQAAAERSALEAQIAQGQARQVELEEQQSQLTAEQALLVEKQAELELRLSELEELNADLSQRPTQADLQQVHDSYQEQLTESANQHQALYHQHTLSTQAYERELTFTRLAVKSLDEYRNRRIFRILERVFDRTDLRNGLPASLQAIMDDSLLFSRNLDHFVLQASRNLQHVPYIGYRISPGKEKLNGIVLAPIIDVHPRQGVIGVEVVSPEIKIVAQAVAPADQIDFITPVYISFPPISGTSTGVFELRVFARELDVPVQVYEWRRYPWAGAGPLQTLPFCGFHFVE